MAASEPGIAQEVVAAVRRAIAERGVAVDHIVPETSELVVAGSSADALFDHAAEVLGDPAVGITIAQTIPLGGLGVIDYTLCTSPTLRDALQRVAEHYGVATQRVKLELVEAEGRGIVRLHRVAGIAHSRHWIEFSVAAMVTRIRETSGLDVGFSEVAFAHPAPADQSAHDALFGVHTLFDAPLDRFVFDAAHLDQPLRTASATLASLLDLRIRELAPELAALDPLLDRVRRTLAAMLDERRTEIDELVRRLGTSKRSLQRSLGELGTSHSELLDQLRRERAVQLLDRGLRVAEVATALGFTAPSAFFRAYRRWTGMSPKGQRDLDE